MSEDEDLKKAYFGLKNSWQLSSSALNLLQYVHLVNAENVEATQCRPYRISENCRVN